MASALGTLTLVDSIQQEDGVWIDRVTLTGDADYPALGTVGLLAALRAAKKAPGLTIIGVRHAVASTGDYHLEYNPATDKLVSYNLTDNLLDHTETTPGVDMHLTTFSLAIISK
jgi:hypothetical protein